MVSSCFPDSSVGKESSRKAGDPGLIPGSGRFTGEWLGYPLQYSGLENSMDCIVHGVTKNQTPDTTEPTFTSLSAVKLLVWVSSFSLLSLSILSHINPTDHREVTRRCFLWGDLRAMIWSWTCYHLTGLWTCSELKKPYLQLWKSHICIQSSRCQIRALSTLLLPPPSLLKPHKAGEWTRECDCKEFPHFQPFLPIKIAKGGIKIAFTSLAPVRYPMNILNWRNPFWT